MTIEVEINNSALPSARYLGWAPSPCRVRQVGGGSPLAATLTTGAGSKGAISFYSSLTSAPSSKLDVILPANGAWVDFLAGGQFQKPSERDQDTALTVASGGAVQLAVPLMIRVRKNANNLTANERDRFVNALATLNNKGAGSFRIFRAMHTMASNQEAHGGPAFLPWHRVYLLDVERELQAISPDVTIPYWKFDEPAPNLFHLDFIGEFGSNGLARFGTSNPLQFWSTDGIAGIDRSPRPNAPKIRTEASTLGLGGAQAKYGDFRGMEGNPHGNAHVSFQGFLEDIGMAVRDPLFFLLHCNVDRLWAKWQWLNKRFDSNTPESFQSGSFQPGHNLADTMWPWNGIVTPPRPNPAPGGVMASTPVTRAPGGMPKVRQPIDYQGKISSQERHGFDYDDVPFQ